MLNSSVAEIIPKVIETSAYTTISHLLHSHTSLTHTHIHIPLTLSLLSLYSSILVKMDSWARLGEVWRADVDDKLAVVTRQMK